MAPVFSRPFSVATIRIRISQCLENLWQKVVKEKNFTYFAIMSSISKQMLYQLVFQLVGCLAGGQVLSAEPHFQDHSR